jgi:FMN reductase
MGARHVVQGWFVLDRRIAVSEGGSVALEADTERSLHRVLDQFAEALPAGEPRVPASAA